MHRTEVLWLVPLFMAIHNAEEAVAIPEYLPAMVSRIPTSVLAVARAPTPQQMQLALLLVTVFPIVVAAWMTLSTSKATAVWLLLLIQATLLLNVAWHLSAAVVFQGYVPGLVTALSINLPFSIYIFRRAAQEQWVSPRARLVLIPGALLLHGPALVGLLLLLK